MGSKEAGEMQFWTKDEYLRFSDAISDKPLAFYAFEVLYWMGDDAASSWRSRPRTS